MNLDHSHNPPFLDMTQLKEALRVINVSLNKSAKSGVYTLDEAYVVKISLSQFEKAVEILDQYQTNHINQQKTKESS